MYRRIKSEAVRKLLVGVVVVSLSAVIYGQKGDQQKIDFYLDGKVGTEEIKRGRYTVSIPEIDQGALEIKVGKKVVTAQFTKRQNPSESDADKMTYRENGDGTRTIATITPRGRKYTLVLDNSGVAEQR
ncbi:MAG: hypothetical protein L0220_15795 [Acidobacteria bacterium]|nr:hypothetical protein [Acidobacteriota bacterium]